MSDYRDILRKADAHFERVITEQPENLQCRLGCTMCCHGLFEIGAADVTVVAEGLMSLAPETRQGVVERAGRIVHEFAHPDLRTASENEKEAFFERTGDVACPALDEGRCVIYASRPVVCRTFGLPLREGPIMLDEVCELNFTNATREEMERAAWDLLDEDVLGADDQFTIPEAILIAARIMKPPRNG